MNSELIRALEALISVYKEEKVSKRTLEIPVSVFSNRKLGVLEACIKFLHESAGLRNCIIARLLNRDERTVWSSYNNAKRKEKEKFRDKAGAYSIPVSIFSDRRAKPLQALTSYLKEDLNLSYNQISSLLKRDYRTIWLTHKNAIRKKGYYGPQ